MRKKILFICQEAGGTAVLLPVIHKLKNDRKYNLKIIGYEYGKIMLKKNGIRASFPKESKNPKELRLASEKTISSERPNLIVSGSDSNNVSLEKEILKVSARSAIKSLVVLDSWSRYRERFSEFLPTQIAVMDSTAKNDLCRLGIPAKRVKITGSPQLETLAQAQKSKEIPIQKKMSRRFKLNPRAKTVLFIADSFDFPLRGSSRWGVFRKKKDQSLLAAEILVETLDKLEQENNASFACLIKTHPKNNPREIRLFNKLKNNSKVKVVSKVDNRELIMASDIVVGSLSILLIEAALLNKNVVSFVFNKRQKNELLLNRFGFSHVVHNKKELTHRLKNLLVDQKKPPVRRWKAYMPKNIQAGASDKIIGLIHRLLK